MTQFNELIDNNRAQLVTYLEAITAADVAAAEGDLKPVEIPPALAETSLAAVADKAKKLQTESVGSATLTAPPTPSVP